MKKLFSYIGALAVLLIILLPLFFRSGKNNTETVTIQCDTVVIRDTIRDTVPRYRDRYITRIDTVFLSPPDSLHQKHEVVIPIEQRTYVTEDYHAIVEGYNPSLTYMEVYKKTEYINRTEYIRERKKNRFNFGVQVGIGTTGKEISPYIGLGLQYNLFQW